MADQTSELDWDEYEVDETDPAEFASASAELEKRCDASNIKYTSGVDSLGDIFISLELPSGRDKRSVHLYDLEGVKAFLAVPFENYVILNGYNAICSYKDGLIEAELQSLRALPNHTILRKLFGLARVPDKQDNKPFVIEIPQEPENGNCKILLLPLPSELSVLYSRRIRRFPALKIEGLQVSTNDDAINILERIANSIFFQIDLATDIPLSLVKERRPAIRQTSLQEEAQFQFPRNEFDKAPMALYWYARSATGMPLLQFLAYYQSIEFYFPIYSKAEARRKIRNILKDPNFRSERDSDIGKILSSTNSYGSFGDERSQLRSTIQECVDAEDLRQFLTSDELRKKFFTKSKSLTEVKIPIDTPNADLRNDVAERIYDIRCKIVHTKMGSNEGDVELLLPFSKEAELLNFDIELIQYIARRTVISGSSPLKL